MFIYIYIYVYKEDVALNSLQVLVFCKTQPTNQNHKLLDYFILTTCILSEAFQGVKSGNNLDIIRCTGIRLSSK